MANPQPDKYTKISNEILCHLVWVNLSSYETRILLYIIRKTYGYNKKEDNIPLSQFVIDCRIRKPLVCRTLKSLSKKIMIISRDNNRGKIYSIQKDWEKWPLSKEITQIISRDNKQPQTNQPQSLSLESTSKDKRQYIKRNPLSKDKGVAKKQPPQEVGKKVDKKRKEIRYPKEIVNEIANYYVQRKGIIPQGNEWLPIQQAVKSMLMNGRLPSDIKEFIYWLSTNWATWDIHTVMKRMPEFLAGKLDREKNRINQIKNDAILKRIYELKQKGDLSDAEFRLQMSLMARLEEKYPAWKYERDWEEVRKLLSTKLDKYESYKSL